MPSTAKKLLDEALSLPEEELEEFVTALSDSLDPEPGELSPEWNTEIGGRIAQVESGEVSRVSWNEVTARIKASLGYERERSEIVACAHPDGDR